MPGEASIGPDDGLTPFVSRLVTYDEMGPAGVHRGLPSTGITLVLPIDDPIDVSWSEASPWQAGHQVGWSLLSGLHTQPAHIHHGTRQRGLQVTLTVAGARALLGVPAAALQGELIDLDAAVPALRWLPERLHDEPTWSGRARVARQALRTELARREGPTSQPEVGEALQRLACGGSVQSVADEVGYSRRRLSTLVRTETGVTPKQWARLARFERSKDLLDRSPTLRLADVAARVGYADHAHLTRDWVELAGCPPSTWRSDPTAPLETDRTEECPNVQASPAVPGDDGPTEPPTIEEMTR